MQLVSKYNLQTLHILHLRSFELGIMSNSLSLGSQGYHYVENTASNSATKKETSRTQMKSPVINKPNKHGAH